MMKTQQCGINTCTFWDVVMTPEANSDWCVMRWRRRTLTFTHEGGVDNNRTGVLLLILVVWLVQQSPMQIKEMEAFTFKVEILPFAVWFSVVPYRIGLVVLNWEPEAGMSKPCRLVCLHRSISPAIHQCLGYLSPYKEVETHSSFNVLVPQLFIYRKWPIGVTRLVDGWLIS